MYPPQSRKLIVAALLILASTATPVRGSSQFEYTDDRRWRWSSGEGTLVTAWLRTQFRAFDEQRPSHYDQFDDPDQGDAELRRGRFKLNIQTQDGLKIAHEYDWNNDLLYDLQLAVPAGANGEWLLGQWKPEFSYERKVSSGKQTMAERSIVNYWMQIDRQTGLAWHGKSSQTQWPVELWAAVLSGTGPRADYDGSKPMGLVRLQWNNAGGGVGFSSSDITPQTTARSQIGISLLTNTSAYTRYSSSGGSQLPGFTEGSRDRYQLWQVTQDWRWSKNGLALQQELHWKRIEDKTTGSNNDIYGAYIQLGYIPPSLRFGRAGQIELATRLAWVDIDYSDTHQGEAALALNWFLTGHRNKFTLEVNRQYANQTDAVTRSDTQVVLQWDVCF